jgi:hypothetical protein
MAASFGDSGNRWTPVKATLHRRDGWAAQAEAIKQDPDGYTYRGAYRRRPLNAEQHILHLLLTVVTLGLWAPVWIIRAKQGNRMPIPLPPPPYGQQPPYPPAGPPQQYPGPRA